jgi:hypothetical protein
MKSVINKNGIKEKKEYIINKFHEFRNLPFYYSLIFVFDIIFFFLSENEPIFQYC